MFSSSSDTVAATSRSDETGEALFLFLPPFEKEDRGGFSSLRLISGN